MQIKAYDKLNYKAAYFALYNAIKAKGVKVNENVSLTDGVNLIDWSEEDKVILAALISVKMIDKAKLADIKPTNTITRGEAADYVYKLTVVKDAADEVISGGANIGLILGITIPVAVVLAGAGIAIFVIKRKKAQK